MVPGDLPDDESPAALAEQLFGSGDDPMAFIDDTELEVVAATGKDGKEEEELKVLSNKDVFPTLNTKALPEAPATAPRTQRKGVRPSQGAASSLPPALRPGTRAPAKAGRQCRHCGTEGSYTLCNVCGIQYKRGALLPEYRPLNIPTSSPDLHSNHHQRVIDMARSREEEKKESFLSDADLEAIINDPALQALAASGMDEHRDWVLKNAFQPGTLARKKAGQQCRHCGTYETPLWHICTGPEGRFALWGIQYCNVTLLPEYPPLKTPTSPDLHSDWRQCVIDTARFLEAEWSRSGIGLEAFLRDMVWDMLAASGHYSKEELESLSKAASTLDTMALPEAAATAQLPQTMGVRWSREAASSPLPALQPGNLAPAKAGQQCRHCGTYETPQWRICTGPEGRFTLCDACGIQYSNVTVLPEYRP